MVGASFQGPKPPVTPLIHPFYVTFNTPLPSPGGSAPAAAGQIAEVNCALRHHIRRLTTESERRAELSKSRRVLGSAPFRRGAANPHPHCPPRCTRTACPRRARCLFCLHTTRPVTCSFCSLPFPERFSFLCHLLPAGSATRGTKGHEIEAFGDFFLNSVFTLSPFYF